MYSKKYGACKVLQKLVDAFKSNCETYPKQKDRQTNATKYGVKIKPAHSIIDVILQCNQIKCW